MFRIRPVFKLFRSFLFPGPRGFHQFENLSKSTKLLIVLITVIMKLLIALALNGDTVVKVETKISIQDVMQKMLTLKYQNNKRLCHWMVICLKISTSYRTLI